MPWPRKPGQRSLKVIENVTIRQSVYVFLLTVHSNHGPLSYRFREDGDFSRKSQNCPTPIVFCAPAEGVPFGIVYRRWGSKTRMMRQPGRWRSLRISSAVWIECTNVSDRRTDGHTPGHSKDLTLLVLWNYMRRAYQKANDAAAVCICVLNVGSVIYETSLDVSDDHTSGTDRWNCSRSGHFMSMDTSAGRSTEARGLSHAFPAYDPRDTLAWLWTCRPDRPSLCSGCDRRETKLIIRPCGETLRLDDHTPAHCALSQVAAARTDSRFGPGWRRRPGRPRYSWIQQIGDGTPFSIRAEWSKARRRGHSGLTQRTSAVYAIWWWWCWWWWWWWWWAF